MIRAQAPRPLAGESPKRVTNRHPRERDRAVTNRHPRERDRAVTNRHPRERGDPF